MTTPAKPMIGLKNDGMNKLSRTKESNRLKNYRINLTAARPTGFKPRNMKTSPEK